MSRHVSTTPLYRTTPTPTDIPQTQALSTDALGTSAHDMWAADAAATLAEGETFASLGLGGYSPVGLLQSSMELVHNFTGLPWWGTIVISTLCIRTLFLPISILMQKNSVKLHNVNPEVDKFKQKQQIYILAGNAEMALVERSKMNAVFKEHSIRPFLSALPMFFQGVFLVSFFLAIRGMANAPVSTMMAGGALWFPDLTVPDPSFLLPMISCGGFMISMELGGEAGVMNPQMAKMKYVMRILAIVMIGITAKFPAGVFMYWLTSTSYSISFALLMRISGVRQALGIGEIIKHPTSPEKSRLDSWTEERKRKRKVAEQKEEVRQAKQHHKKQKNDKNPKLYYTNPKSHSS